jgi:hypothetical protein
VGGRGGSGGGGGAPPQPRRVPLFAPVLSGTAEGPLIWRMWLSEEPSDCTWSPVWYKCGNAQTLETLTILTKVKVDSVDCDKAEVPIQESWLKLIVPYVIGTSCHKMCH